MSLDKSKLESQLITWLTNQTSYTTKNDAFSAFCDAYEQYLLDSVDVVGDPIEIYYKSNGLDTLNTINNTDTAESAADKFEDGIIDFIILASFENITIPPGCTVKLGSFIINFLGTDIIKNGLTTIFQDLSSSSTIQTKASQIATILDTGTKLFWNLLTGTNASPPPATLIFTGYLS